MMKWHVASLNAFLHHPFQYLAILNSVDKAENEILARAASNLGLVYLILHPSEDDVSKRHASAVQTGLSFILGRNSPVPLKDALVLLDSDMYLTSTTKLEQLLGNAHIASVMQTRDRVSYLWPNFCIFRLPHRQLYDKLKFAPAVWVNHEDGSFHSLDSGGSTAIFLNRHAFLTINHFSVGVQCLDESNQPICHFQETTLAHDRPSECREGELLSTDVNTTGCEHCERLYIYHLGSAGSNWRGCPEEYLEERRTEWKTFLREIIQATK